MKPFAQIDLMAVETYLRYWEMADMLANSVRVINADEHDEIKTRIKALLYAALQD